MTSPAGNTGWACSPGWRLRRDREDRINAQRSILVGHPLALPILLSLAACAGAEAAGREPIPDRLVVLTFDDSVKSHFTVARPVLKRYGFGATFFITEGFHFATDKAS